MKRVKFVFVVTLLFVCSTTRAQFGDRLKNAAKNAAENAAVRKTEQKTDQAVSKGIDKATDPNSYKGEKKDDTKKDEPKAKTSNADNEDPPANTKQAGKSSEPQSVKSLEMAYAKSDFVAGDEIIFDDDGSREKLGEFPSQWDLISGVAEILAINNEKAIRLGGGTSIAPLMNNMKEYLPDAYTIELDFYNFEKSRITGGNDWYHFYFCDKDKRAVFDISVHPGHDDKFFRVSWYWKTPDGEERRGAEDVKNSPTGKFYRMSVSFNKRALKVYFDGVRLINIPNCAKASNFYVHSYGNSNNVYFIKNIRMAKGAVPLYDRMISEGKFITYGITFDIGKSTIKPESMGEINRIVELMKENPDLKFSVEGHTDNTGTSANNQTLSEARSQAVVDKLVEMGIAKNRLKAAGKGQTSPIADNSTDEGRAKNRRVEFVKF